ncbi:sulfatase-like hydrolase/transferase [Polaribacter septentrionalilitoris]|uniref:sulfatase-like hydrolase/transferase n=1 Tax=Polaribacter septentrionalilitoris TaxID=2494657 RepID=UPI00135BFABB|nr:sulfatase-like hydrolase/transferase [Polaribacter septentrionalilitoris]
MKNYILLVFVAFFCFKTISAQNKDKSKPNILLICVDDLRNNLGAYGDKEAITPNIDKLAKQGVTFRNHQVQYAVCGPSRAALTTGLMPEETGVIGFKPIRRKLPDVTFLPEYFKNNGYITAAAGKIHDPRTVGNPKNKSKDGDDVASWSIPYLAPKGGYRVKHMALDFQDLPEEKYVDGIIREKGIQLLEEVAKKDKPFFMAIGFKKPHEPFIAPKKYWDLYNNTNFKIAENQNAPIGRDDLKTYALKGKDVKQNMNPKTGLINEDFQLKLKQGYYACTSFVDAQIGLVIDKLEKLGVTDNTIIVLWGDHGLFLGEHGRWNKHSNLEVASSSPLIIIDPRNPKAKGNTFAAVSTVDIYPTLCELAGLEIPEQPKNEKKTTGRAIKGRSLVPILNNTDAQVKIGAITVYRGQRGLGYGYRVKGKYRYIEWVKKGKENFYELYDYQIDPNETRNLAVVEKETYAPLLHKFSRNIRSFGEGDGCKALLRTKPYQLKDKSRMLVRDADGDGIPDDKEAKGDANGDGIPNYLDAKN